MSTNINGGHTPGRDRHRLFRKGSYTVEAALFLPLFIIAFLMIASFIKVAGAQETIMHVAADECRWSAAHAYNIKTDPTLPVRFQVRVLKENDDLSGLIPYHYEYLTEKDGNEGMIALAARYSVKAVMPLGFQKRIDRDERILCRAWIGRTKNSAEAGVDDSGMVWIFPENGKKYHTHECTYVNNVPEQVALNRNILDHYDACHLCHPETLPEGSQVYCFPKYGEAYHRGGCKSIDKYTISVTKNQAEEKGYTPCSKCGGI